MARWGTFKWGSGVKWGASTPPARNLTWALEVDWDNDGSFDGTNESPYMVDMNIRRGREFLMSSSGQGFQPRFAGNLRITLKNLDGRYDPYNTSGPLYGLLEMNQKIRIRVKDESTGTIYPVFYGRIDDIRPNYAEIPTVTLYASDGISLLSKAQVSSSAVYTSEQYDDAISAILTAANWPDSTDIDTSISDTMAYWWMDGTSAYGQIVDLTDAVLGNFFISADGAATFRPRSYSDSSLVTFTDTDALYSWKIRTPSPRDTIKNIARVYSRGRSAQTGIEIWRLIDVPVILPGDSATIWASYNYNGASIPVTSVTAPVATTDYTANTAPDGSGTNLTSQFSITLTNFATSAKLIVTNNSASTGYLTLLKLRGNGIITNDYTYAESQNATSVSKYGARTFEVKTDWLQDVNSATDQANIIINLLSVPRRYPQFMVRGKPAKQFALDLFDLATINFVSLNIGADMRVSYIEHNIVNNTAGNICDTVFYFEPNFASGTGGAWTFPATFPMTFA